MPDITDDVPRLAEIARTIQDFRAEWREAMSNMVRKDVYAANMLTLETKIEALAQEARRQSLELEKAKIDLAQEIEKNKMAVEKESTERRNSNGRVLFAIGAAALSLLMGAFQVVSK